MEEFNMRIAFVFSGILREVDKNSNSILSKIHEYNADVYGSFWDIENPEDGSTISNFIRTYKPKRMEVESYDGWIKANWDTISQELQAPTQLNSHEQEYSVKPNIFSMWYKIWRGNMLTKLELIEYDIVVRIRTDLGISDNFSLAINDCINIPHGIVNIVDWQNCYGMHDFIAYGNPRLIDYYSSLFMYISRYLKEGQYVYPSENLLRHHLSQKKINIRYYGDTVRLRDTGNVHMNEPNKPEVIISSDTYLCEPERNITFYKSRYE